MSRIFGSSYAEKQEHLGKYIVLLNGFPLGFCHLQSHLCLSTFGMFSLSMRHLAVTVDWLGCGLPCLSPGLQRLFQESVTDWDNS